jgi:uncharacterized protein (TIGR03437 family)
LGILVLIILAALSPAFAVPVTYQLTGYVQASAGGKQMDAPFVWTAVADTSGMTSTSANHYQNPAASSHLDLTGVGGSDMTGVTVYLDTSTGQVTFGSMAGGIGLTSSRLKTWDLASPVGPLNGANFLVAGTITSDSGGVVTLTGVVNTNNGPSPTFQATQPPPGISAVTNAASNILPGLPNGGIAQGAIFIVYGSGLGPARIVISPAPFQSTTLSDTSVAVTVGGTKVNAPLYYTSAGQVAALLPSNTPTGTGTIMVTYNGRSSPPTTPITVVANNVGVFTVGSDGQGAAIVTYPDYSLVSPAKDATCGGPSTPCGAANPGDTLILWATGLGPATADDASGLGQNMPAIPLKVWLGGVQAPVIYQGRSGCCIGEDQIVFTVPAGVPTGCAVPLLLEIGNQTSNSTLVPVAAGSRQCTPTNAALATVDAQQLVASGSYSFASIALETVLNGAGKGSSDIAKFQFAHINSFNHGAGPFAITYLDDQPLGTCTVYNALSPKQYNGLSATTTDADAGANLTVTGPNGSRVLAAGPGQSAVTISPTATYLSPGAYTVTGSGGADIGAFSAAFTVPTPPTLTSPSPTNHPAVTRANGMTVTWTGGAPNTTVQLQLQGPTDSTYSNGALVFCNVDATAGTFTIPPYALEALPASTSAGLVFVQQTAWIPFTASGLDSGMIQAIDETGYIGTFALN